MTQQTPENRPTLDIRKYPNRRYYDATRSTHVTLEQIHTLIREGHDIRVADSKTGQDITAKVLAQIILELDPPKLDVFSSHLLHQLIRSNEVVMTDFVEKYFNQALTAFLESQKRFDAYLRQAVGLAPGHTPAMMPMGLFGPFAPGAVPPLGTPAPGADTEAAELRKVVEELREQVARLASPAPKPRSKGRSRGKSD